MDSRLSHYNVSAHVDSILNDMNANCNPAADLSSSCEE